VVAFPFAHLLFHAGAMPAAAARLGKTLMVDLQPIGVGQYVQDQALKASDLWGGPLSLRPLVPALAALALVGARPRQWLAPAAWIALGAAFAGGVVLLHLGPLVVPGPFAWILQIPLLGRLWWPERGLVLVAPALALLAGGGAHRLGRVLGPFAPWIAACLLVIEAQLVLPQLPLHPTGMPRPQALALAQGQGPLLVLPLPGGPLGLLGAGSARGASGALVDQVVHGRPLVDWTVTPGIAPLHPTVSQLWDRSALLRQLWACETLGALSLPEHGTRPGAELDLTRYGVREVVVDMSAVPTADAAAYLACVEEVLGPPEREEEGLRVFGLTRQAATEAIPEAPQPPTP
jgi:hypothetical protein